MLAPIRSKELFSMGLPAPIPRTFRYRDFLYRYGVYTLAIFIPSWFLADHKKKGEAGASTLYSSSSWVPTHADFMSL